MRLIWAREARTLLAYERRAAMACERTFLVSEPECRRFLELAPEADGRVVPIENGVDLERFAPGLASDTPYTEPGPHLVFVGNMDYWPNADAAGWFAREVLPLVRAATPGARIHVVGADPGPDVLALNALPSCTCHGPRARRAALRGPCRCRRRALAHRARDPEQGPRRHGHGPPGHRDAAGVRGHQRRAGAGPARGRERCGTRSPRHPEYCAASTRG